MLGAVSGLGCAKAEPLVCGSGCQPLPMGEFVGVDANHFFWMFWEVDVLALPLSHGLMNEAPSADHLMCVQVDHGRFTMIHLRGVTKCARPNGCRRL